MEQVAQQLDRRTSAHVVFDFLYKEINDLRLLPGDKLSEAEIASRFDISRQPVRDAFSRLENLDLLLIRPQKATVVKRFSMRAIEKARFVRASIEAEVLRRAATNCDDDGAAALDACLDRQRVVVEADDYASFGALDYEFHKTLCHVAGVDFAFEVISDEKAKVDRLCVLSLSGPDRMSHLLEDHEGIAKAVQGGDAAEATKIGMFHLSRLDATIQKISSENADYFEE